MDKIVKNKIDELLKIGKVIVAIEGGCTSGKTTLSKEISKFYDCNIIHIDDFFLSFDKRTESRMNEVGGNIDYERFRSEVAEKIVKNEPFTYGKFDCSLGRIKEQIKVMPKKLNIIEGVYSLHPLYSDIYTLKIFLEIDNQTQLERLKARSPEKLDKFINEWIPKENKYFTNFDIKNSCEIIL